MDNQISHAPDETPKGITPETNGATQALTRPWYKRKRFWFAALALKILSLVIFGLLFAVPIPISVVSPRIVASIEEQLGPGYDVSMDNALLENGENGPELRLNEFAIKDPNGITVLKVPRAAIGLDGNFVLGRNVGIRHIRLVQPRLIVRVDNNKQVSLAGAEGAPPLFTLPTMGEHTAAAPVSLVGLFSVADGLVGTQGRMPLLENIDIVDGSIRLDDRRRDEINDLNNIDLNLKRLSDRQGYSLSGESSFSSQNRSRFHAEVITDPEARALNVTFNNLSLGRIFYETQIGNDRAKLEGALYGYIRLKMNADDRVEDLDTRFDIIGLNVHVQMPQTAPPNPPPFNLDMERLLISGRWNATEEVIDVTLNQFEKGKPRAVLGGVVRPLAQGNENLLGYHLRGQNIVLPPAQPDLEAVLVENLDIQGYWNKSEQQFIMTTGTLYGPMLSLAGGGNIVFSQKPPVADIGLAGGKTSISSILGVWPQFVAPRLRTWIKEHIDKGSMSGFGLAVKGPLGRLPPELSRNTVIDMEFEEARLHFMDNAPPLEAAKGTVSVRDYQLDVRVNEATIIHKGTTLALSQGQFFAANNRPDAFPATISTHVKGDVSTVGTLLDTPELRKFSPTMFNLKEGKGRVDGKLTLEGMFGHGVPLPLKLDVALEARFNALDIPTTLQNKRLSGGPLVLNVTKDAIGISGEAAFDSAPFALEGKAVQDPATGQMANIMAAFTFNPADMKGMASSPLKIAGPVSARLDIPSVSPLQSIDVQADISGAAVEGVPGLVKNKGQPGNVAFQLNHKNSHWVLDNFNFKSGLSQLIGGITLDTDGSMDNASFSTFRLNAGDDARLDLKPYGAGGYALNVRGASLDIRTFLKNAFSMSGTATTKPIDMAIDAKLGTVTGHNGEIISGLDLKLERKNGAFNAIAMKGLLGSSSLNANLESSGMIAVQAEDAGAALRYFDFYKNVRGGLLNMRVNMDNAVRGRVVVSDFAVMNEKALAAVAARGGAANQRVAGQANFTRLAATFALANGQLNLENTAIWGPDVGASLEGEINFPRNSLNMRGTFVPAYALNNFFSKIPIVGFILGGGRNEGLLGITFQVTGSMDKPDLRINPMSAVAPGFLRKIFEFQKTGVSENLDVNRPLPSGNEPENPAAAPAATPMRDHAIGNGERRTRSNVPQIGGAGR